jgi:hypothetical protein
MTNEQVSFLPVGSPDWFRPPLRCCPQKGPKMEADWEAFILQGIDAYMIVCGLVAARGALLDYRLDDYQHRLE